MLIADVENVNYESARTYRDVAGTCYVLNDRRACNAQGANVPEQKFLSVLLLFAHCGFKAVCMSQTWQVII